MGGERGREKRNSNLGANSTIYYQQFVKGASLPS